MTEPSQRPNHNFIESRFRDRTESVQPGHGGAGAGTVQGVTLLWNTAGLADNLNVYTVLSGLGISNNFSAVNTTGALTISQVPSPWIHTFQYLTAGGFQIGFYGTVGRACSLLASTNLVNWTPVLSFTCTNAPMSVVDPGAKNIFTIRTT